MPFTDGYHPDISNEDYHADAAVSKSRLVDFRKAPAKAQVHSEDTTKAQSFGSLIHTAILEPHALTDRYTMTKLERKGTKAWDAEEAAAMGRELVKEPDWNYAMQIATAVHRTPFWSEVVYPADVKHVERSLFWTHPKIGIQCRARPDMHIPELKLMIDIKSCADASPEGFRRSLTEFFYDFQAAHYTNGAEALGDPDTTFLFLAVEKEPPFLTGLYEINSLEIEDARREIDDLLYRYAECVEANVWPGYYPKVMTLDLTNRKAFR